MKVLLDTNVLSHWLSGDVVYKPRFEVLLAELEQDESTLFISVITLQELGVWGLAINSWPELLARVLELTTPLVFAQPTAEKAAELFHDSKPAPPKKPPVKKETGAEVRHRLDVWHRDAALVATAMEQKIELIVTTDGRMATRFRNHFKGGRFRVL